MPGTVASQADEHGPQSGLADVFSALQAIDELDASVLRLIYGRSLTQSQVAAQLGLAELEISRRVARGLSVLGDVLAPPARRVRSPA